MRIFVGKGDIVKQNKLASKRKSEGWIVEKYDTSDNVVDALYFARGVIVVGNGADAAACVPGLIDEALNRGARKVIVPLDKVMTVFEKSDNPLQDRADQIARALQARKRPLDDKRILITPTKIWKEAIRRQSKE